MSNQPNIRKLESVLQKIAQTELNENSFQTIQSGLESVKAWLLLQPHLTARLDDQFLVAFLRCCKHSVERAKEKLDAFYTIRTATPEIFENQNSCDEKMQKIAALGISIYLPEPHPITACRIVLNRPFCYDPNDVTLNDILKFAFMASDLAMINDDHLIVAGQEIIIDLKGLSTAYAHEITPMILKTFTKAIQDGYPYRQKGIHFLNPPKIFELFFKIFYSFLNEKFKQRIHVHDSLESLYKYIPKNLLPIEYGGQLKDINSLIGKMQEDLLKNNEWFQENNKFKTNERKRVIKSKYNDDFGTDGTFRKLDFD